MQHIIVNFTRELHRMAVQEAMDHPNHHPHNLLTWLADYMPGDLIASLEGPVSLGIFKGNGFLVQENFKVVQMNKSRRYARVPQDPQALGYMLSVKQELATFLLNEKPGFAPSEDLYNWGYIQLTEDGVSTFVTSAGLKLLRERIYA